LGADGLLAAIEILQGYEAPAEAWESAILPARVDRYDPDDLERLCLGGQVAWVRPDRRPAGTAAPRTGAFHRGSLITMALREDLPWLVRRAPRPPLSSRAAAVAAHLEARGASFPADVAAALGMLP